MATLKTHVLQPWSILSFTVFKGSKRLHMAQINQVESSHLFSLAKIVTFNSQNFIYSQWSSAKANLGHWEHQEWLFPFALNLPFPCPELEKLCNQTVVVQNIQTMALCLIFMPTCDILLSLWKTQCNKHCLETTSFSPIE